MCLEDECRRLTRREFIATSSAITVGSLTGLTTPAEGQPSGDLPSADAPFLAAALHDPRVAHGPAIFMSGDTAIRAHVARPRGAGLRRLVLVNHGNPGVPEDVRAALAHLAQLGYAAITFDSDTRSGGRPGEIARSANYYRSESFARQILGDNTAALAFMRDQSFVASRGDVAMLGFCGGGYSVLRQATELTGVLAVVALYTAPAFPPERTNAADPRPNLETFIDQVAAPVQFHYGTQDPLIPLPLVERFQHAVRDHRAVREVFLYDGAGHAFCDYTANEVYNEAAARLAYERIDRFLAAHYPA